MSEYTFQEARVALAVVRFGLRLSPSDLTGSEKRKILRGARDLIAEGHDPQLLVKAARYGMNDVWPYNEGQVWGIREFRDNITKAKACVRALSRAGRLPQTMDEIKEGD